ncbi:MAG: chemotaxis response regulator protein-glutamate methylesterase [Phycisphaerales bacterium]|nr:chemotaxis response regulator protein-glutamate methylesterase [Phycisphaerales bacterium]
MPLQKIRVLIIDDSPLIRGMLETALRMHPQIEVVGTAVDGIDALAKLATLNPDVATLDVEMPRLNGIGVLERSAGKVQTSFIMVSTLTQSGARITFEALQKGAFDYITKPTPGQMKQLDHFRARLHDRVLAAANNKGQARKLVFAGSSSAPTLPPNRERGWVVCIGISCGGPQTLHKVLPAFPSDFVPILITQHMPSAFTATFARHLDADCAMNVREAVQGEPLQAGSILIAPGSHHLKVGRRGAELIAELDEGPKVSGHRPSADVLFDSAAKICGPRCIGVIMTGMGNDGANGIVRLRHSGAWTIAQDSDTSLVFGMPKAAIETGCIDHIVPLEKIPQAIARLMAGGAKKTASLAGAAR